MSLVRRPNRIFEHQADAVLSQANPVSGTKYTVLAATPNVRLIMVHAIVTWTVQPTPLEIHITADGQLLTFPFTNPVTATQYAPNSWAGNDPGGFLSVNALTLAFILEGRSVKVEVETTGGTVSNIGARVKYAKLP